MQAAANLLQGRNGSAVAHDSVGAFQWILSILIGGMLVYFRYRLFLSLPSKRGRDGDSGEFSLSRGSKVKLSKVGPGVFFAIFGAGVIAYSFARPMKVNIPGTAPSAKRSKRIKGRGSIKRRPSRCSRQIKQAAPVLQRFSSAHSGRQARSEGFSLEDSGRYSSLAQRQLNGT